MPQRRNPQANWWIGTIARHQFMPFLPPGCGYIRGQMETGAGGFVHWQLVIYVPLKKSLVFFRDLLGNHHFEPTRSAAAVDYVWKEDTRVAGTQFEIGIRPFRPNNAADWALIKEQAQRGDLEAIPAMVYVRNYRTLKLIASDHVRPDPMERVVKCFWGATGTGKSRTAWAEAGLEAYPKDPMTKFWCGYAGEKHVVIDEFRGILSIGHLLRWLDRYPVRVEVKGSTAVLRAETIWITSNLDPRQWYPDLDEGTKAALLRRLHITHFN